MDVTFEGLDRTHMEFLIDHKLDVAIHLDRAQHEVTVAPNGVPVSLIFDADGVSAFVVTQDGTTIHALLKAHRAVLGLPEGAELALSVSVAQSPVVDFHRVYGVLELGTLFSDLQSVVQDLKSPEWRETVSAMLKMLVCAQLDKFTAMKGVPAFVVSWVDTSLKPTCNQ